jgi:hypothetical protein
MLHSRLLANSGDYYHTIRHCRRRLINQCLFLEGIIEGEMHECRVGKAGRPGWSEKHKEMIFNDECYLKQVVK